MNRSLITDDRIKDSRMRYRNHLRVMPSTDTVVVDSATPDFDSFLSKRKIEDNEMEVYKVFGLSTPTIAQRITTGSYVRATHDGDVLVSLMACELMDYAVVYRQGDWNEAVVPKTGLFVYRDRSSAMESGRIMNRPVYRCIVTIQECRKLGNRVITSPDQAHLGWKDGDLVNPRVTSPKKYGVGILLADGVQVLITQRLLVLDRVVDMSYRELLRPDSFKMDCGHVDNLGDTEMPDL